MIIYFLRHASAGERIANPKKDEKRGLDREGIEQCGYMGRALSALDVQVDAIITSPLKRATQTASLVGNELGHEGKLLLDDALRPEATFVNFRAMLEKHAKLDAIMVVGHNPNLREFLGRIISEGNCDSAVELKKGAAAKVEVNRTFATLQWCLTPKIVRTVYSIAAASARPKTSRK
jgi:phosphohistidine phosphatase